MITKILIAEDDDHTRDALREVLTMEGFEVVAASNGTAAFESFLSERPNIVCLDVMMPGMNGYEVCKRIRKVDEAVPILFLTAKSEEIDKVLGLELGADDYLTKPFSMKEILARLRAILRRSSRQPAKKEEHLEEFMMADLRIVPAELRAYRGEEEIPLSPRDLKVMKLLF
ncbi:MAG: response regulator transcription factor, partial [Verrucomicrobiales bacterium]|nr:response regulator transcription factor [Verrucomicrobiales bacterium]